MKVSELIALLQEMPQDARVFAEDNDSGFYELGRVAVARAVDHGDWIYPLYDFEDDSNSNKKVVVLH